MMRKILLEYKGYHTSIKFVSDDSIFYGKIDGIKDLVFFESDSEKDIEKEFRSAVDGYLEMCEDIGQKPGREL